MKSLLVLLSLTVSSAYAAPAVAKCGAPNDSVCASFIFANGTVAQDIRIDDVGCTDVAYPSLIAGMRVYDCWCGLWSASSSAACNNGDDVVVDQISSCTGEVDGRTRGWGGRVTHVSCFRV